jgi:predicted phosphoadenosine phosphosulfate sulfurtransferase
LGEKHLSANEAPAVGRVSQYVGKWKGRGYPDDIPDEVPDPLMQQGLAPSYKAVAFAILHNDLQFTSLGFAPFKSEWYGILKRIEIEQRVSVRNPKD